MIMAEQSSTASETRIEALKKLKSVFPGLFTGDRLDPEKLNREFGDSVASQGSCYCLNWHGKAQAARLALEPADSVLQPCREESKNWESTRNLYLEGDNLEALKCLRDTYKNKIKMIYIDPPYNTGNDFVYTDDYHDSRRNYLIRTGRSNPADADTDAETEGRYHTDWLNMMYPRLFLAKDFLTEDGVLFISIDDNELDNLKKICGEIFGEDNYINLICLKTKNSSGASGGGEDKRLKKNTEYVLLFAKNRGRMDLKQPVKKIRISDYIAEHKANGVGFYYTRILEDEGEKELLCEKDGIKVYAHKNFRFSTVGEKIKREKISVDQAYYRYFDRIFMVTNAQTSLLSKANEVTPDGGMLISYEYTPKTGRNRGKLTVKYVWNKTLIVWFSDSAEKYEGSVYKCEILGTLWDDISWGRLDLQGGVPFKNGKKPLKLLERLIEMSTDRDSVVMDFFSGSATTAHAVMECNAKDGGRRSFIMVQVPEPIEKKDKLFHAGYHNICEIGKRRICNAGEQIKKETEQHNARLMLGQQPKNMPDTGFRVYRLKSRNIE